MSSPTFSRPEESEPAGGGSSHGRAAAGRGRRYWAAAVAVVILALVAGAVSWGLSNGDRHFPPAREHLCQLLASNDPALRATHARLAESRLRKCLNGGGEKAAPAALWLVVLLTRDDNAQLARSLARQWEMQRQMEQASPSACDANELILAIELLIDAGDLGFADRLVGEVLLRGEQRERILPLAAKLRYDLGRDDDVLAHCREWSSLAPNAPEPWRLLAIVYAGRGFHDQLADTYRTLIRLVPAEAAEFRGRLIAELLATGEVAEARREHDRLASKLSEDVTPGQPDSVSSLAILEARLLQLEGRPDEALALADGILRAKPDDHQALLLVGRIHWSGGRFEPAIAALTRLVALAPSHGEAHYLLGQAHARRGDADQARRHLGEHERIHGINVRIRQLERQASHRPDDVKVRQELAKLNAELGRHENAEFWRRAAKMAGRLGQ